MRLSLEAFTALLKGLNMLSIVVLRSDDLGSLVDFGLSDILASTPAKITSSNDTSELDLKKDPNVVIFRDSKAVESILQGDRRDFRLLAIGSDCSSPENNASSQNLYSRLDQQFYVLCLDRDVLVERYAINGVLKTNIIATYSSKQHWDFVKEQFWERRANLEGLKLRGIADAHVPFTTIVERREFEPPDPFYEEIVELGGPYGEALGILEKALNFTTDLKVRKDGKWGIIDR